MCVYTFYVPSYIPKLWIIFWIFIGDDQRSMFTLWFDYWILIFMYMCVCVCAWTTSINLRFLRKQKKAKDKIFSNKNKPDKALRLFDFLEKKIITHHTQRKKCWILWKKQLKSLLHWISLNVNERKTEK